ncbi:MAG: CHAT domain-containing protein [Cyanobacteriota bacterium]|nr:CHAT domain-containing protein [Cyanobacteriota bacterium]
MKRTRSRKPLTPSRSRRQLLSQLRGRKLRRSPGRSPWRPRTWRAIALALVTMCFVSIGIPAIAQVAANRSLEPGEVRVGVAPSSVASEALAGSLERGKQLYGEGRLTEAVALWQQAAETFQGQGDIFNQTQALNYLSLVYQDLGEWEQAETALDRSVNLLQSQTELQPQGAALLAQALNNRGSLELATGRTEAAIATWVQAGEIYDRAGNETGAIGSQINQATALQTLGQYRRARSILETVGEQLQSQPDSQLKADGLRNLGRALQTVGDLLDAKATLEQSWGISERLGETAEKGATLLAIGNIARDLRQNDIALEYYREAARNANTPIAIVQAQLNELSLLAATERWEAAMALVPKIPPILRDLPPGRAALYAEINLAESLTKLPDFDDGEIAQLLAGTIDRARELGDERAEAYALSQLGNLYAQGQQWQEAKQLNEQSLQIAQRLNAEELSARSSWQLGRVLKQQGETSGAVAAYKNAFDTLQSLRGDLVAISSDVQYGFKDSIEPVYREFVSLLLQPQATQAELKQARDVMEALQLVELDNFFNEACLETRPVQIDQIDPHAAVLHPVILNDRFEVILSLPDGTLRHYSTAIPLPEVDRTLTQLYSSIYLGYSEDGRLKYSGQVYNWLIRPVEAELASYNIETLVFVLDGFLRSLPMGALYDGTEYLLEKYSIALSPGLQLFPEQLERSELQALTAGLTEARQGFSALPGVGVEVEEISAEVDSQVLIDRGFTRKAFEEKLEAQDFGLVHLATHGQFSSNPEETFLLTWDDKIKVNDFDRLLQGKSSGSNPVELLVLSACQTASGDRRAALGLAGFALRSGARSTLATLWSVSDRSTAELMSQFYERLTEIDTDITKAEALRQAQLALLQDPRYNHPYFWAPFVLVGNWL